MTFPCVECGRTLWIGDEEGERESCSCGAAYELMWFSENGEIWLEPEMISPSVESDQMALPFDEIPDRIEHDTPLKPACLN